MLKISKEKNCFIKDGKEFFYLADTVWSAFTNIELDEWEYYLNFRKNQGFNVLQINILPLWDAIESGKYIPPFAINDDGSMNFSRINEDYFTNAKKMLYIAYSMGFEFALVALWANYVPETWCSEMNPQNIMPESFIESYIEYISNCFKKYSPIYLVSGDTDFKSKTAVRFYKKAIQAFRKFAPESILTMHLSGGTILNKSFIV